MTISVGQLAGHYHRIHEDRMQGLPIVNTRLEVETVGFLPEGEHLLGVLVTPWFMNLVLLPGNDCWSDAKQGATARIDLPSGPFEFHVAHDEDLGTHLTAVLFRTVADFPDQETARAIAEEVLSRLRSSQDAAEQSRGPTMSRRQLFGRLGAG